MCIENATYLSLFLFDMVAFHALNVIRKSVYACMNSSWEAEQVAVTYPLPPPSLDESTSPSAGKEFQVSKATTVTVHVSFSLRRMFTVIDAPATCVHLLLSFHGYTYCLRNVA